MLNYYIIIAFKTFPSNVPNVLRILRWAQHPTEMGGKSYYITY